jgi:hypothetical protein
MGRGMTGRLAAVLLSNPVDECVYAGDAPQCQSSGATPTTVLVFIGIIAALALGIWLFTKLDDWWSIDRHTKTERGRLLAAGTTTVTEVEANKAIAAYENAKTPENKKALEAIQRRLELFGAAE